MAIIADVVISYCVVNTNGRDLLMRFLDAIDPPHPAELDPEGRPQPCAWRLPSVGTALAGALFLHRWLTVQSGGRTIRPVGWAQSSAMLVRRRAAEEVGFLDPQFFVYSDETDFCKRLQE